MVDKKYEVLVENIEDDLCYASFTGNHSEIKGCPLGRATTKQAAITDLLKRTNMESKLELTNDSLIIRERK